MKADRCESIFIHEDAIQEVQKHLLKEDELNRVDRKSVV